VTVRVELRDIETEADRRAVHALEVNPDQERFVASVAESFEDAEREARAVPRFWMIDAGDAIVGFVMISDGIPAGRLATDGDLLGPYFLWRLLIDRRHQRRGYGSATLDAVTDYVRARPNGDALLVSAGQGDGSPQPFYERYGFVPTGQIVDGEVVLRLDLRADPASPRAS
jgi:diamine N-acetyltransferase